MARISDGYEVTVYLHAETDAAILVSQTNDEDDAVWIPKSQVEIEKTGRPAVWNVTMPEYIAAKHGFD